LTFGCSGAKPFEQQQFGPAGAEGVNLTSSSLLILPCAISFVFHFTLKLLILEVFATLDCSYLGLHDFTLSGYIFARDAFVERFVLLYIAMMFVRPSVRLSGTGVHCDYTVARIKVYGWIVQCSGHPNTEACPPTPNRLFPVSPGREVGYGFAN